MLLRLWYTLATGLARPRQSLLDECRVTLRLWLNDLDSNPHMNSMPKRTELASSWASVAAPGSSVPSFSP